MNENHPNDRYEQFVELFTKNERNLRSFVRSLLPTWHDADEVVQDVALVAWRKFDEFEPGTSFISWLCVIARFKSLTYRRKMARDRLTFSEQLIELMADEAEPEHLFRQHQYAALESCLNGLSDKHRHLVKIAYTPGFTMKEEAERAGLKPGALYMRLSRIRSLLLDCIQRRLAQEGLV